MSLLQTNMSSLVVGGVILLAFLAVVRNIYKKHKSGDGGCGCGCGNCPSKGMCHPEKK